METKINFEKLTKLDLELLENHNNKIKVIRHEKEQQILITLEQRIRNLYNLINDWDFINEIENHIPNHIYNYLGIALYYYQNDNYINVTSTLTDFIKKHDIDFAIYDYEKQEKAIKKIYIRKLKQAQKIRTE